MYQPLENQTSKILQCTLASRRKSLVAVIGLEKMSFTFCFLGVEVSKFLQQMKLHARSNCPRKDNCMKYPNAFCKKQKMRIGSAETSRYPASKYTVG